MDLCSRPTQPGMHKALLVDEIVRRIAEHLFDSKDKSSSLAFSLCCRSLNDPVLDVLWDWQTDLFTLFKVLPPDLWEVNNTAGLRFLRSPTPNEWDRFRVYAQRMTKLYALPPDHAPSEDILHLVNLDQSKQPLIPRLQLLNWTTSRLSLPWLHLFLSPSISEIHIDLNGGRTTPVNVAVIKALPSIYLKHIAFSNLHTNTEVNTALLDLVCKATRLESVYIQQENDLDHMGPLDDQVEGGREPPELRSLRSITIAFKKEFSFLPSLLDKTTLPSVQQIHLQHLGRTEWLGPDRLFDSMLRSASPDILHALRYTSHYQGMDITSARIQLLRSFVALRTVRVTSSCSSGHCKFFLSDDDISTIATAMPNLVELHLGGTPCASTLVNVSMESLVTLSSNCAKLRDLQTHFDTAGFINRALDVPNEHIPPLQITLKTCQLAQLTVGRIPLPLGRGMDGYWTVGMALLQIFPNLKSIKYHQSTVFGVGDWGEVSRVIKVQRKVANLMSV